MAKSSKTDVPPPPPAAATQPIKADKADKAEKEKVDPKTAAKKEPVPKSDRQWCYVSDQNVRLIPFEEVLKSKAYLCFYERVG